MNEDLIQRVKSTLKEESYSMNEIWLRDCIEYFISENNSITYKEILKFVKTQWQLSDLREINNDNGCLPRNLDQQKNIVLNGTYILQMDKMYDISTSKYKQLEQIRNISNANIEATEDFKPQAWEPRKKRMLMLHLTDGIQDVSAIEYQTITSLNDTLLPGYKVMIIGPVKCRRGVILLEQGKFKEIGGEVESLSITNALENVLARALNCPENPDPYNDKDQQIRNEKSCVTNDPFEDDFEVNLEEVTQIEQRSQEASSTGSTNKRSYIQTNLVDKRSNNQQNFLSSNNSSNGDEENKKNNIIETLDADDELLEMIDENQIIAPTSCTSTNNESTDREIKNVAKPFQVLPKESNDDTIEDDIIVVTDKDRKIRCQSVTTDKGNIMSHSDVYFPEDDFNFDDIDMSAIKESKDVTPKDKESDKQTNLKTNKSFLFQSHSNCESSQYKINKINPSGASSSIQVKHQKEIGNKRFAASPPPVNSSKIRCIGETSNQEKGVRKISEFVKKKDVQEEIPDKFCDFICDILKETVKEVMFRTVRGQFITFGKLSRKNFCWHLEGTITDKTAAIDVAVASEILERFLGFSVKEFSQKRKLAKVNAELEHELRMACRNAELKLKQLDALLELELKPDQTTKVVNITPLTDEQKEIIDKRLRALKI
ncbi:hypothetical protein KPH14_010317 [Odynerus spinipes]|uniref:RecQ-mediated genome instability protein 1 n=1 Tax=Odynerus spinipes TaxID=1348599 RepID=A0AAD9RTT4_9HYME|nr:hypothetical protein KPH14_010317 [Odynerus spinipes]